MIGDSYISYNCYALQSRKKFKQFRQTILDSRPREYNNINDAFELAREHNLRAVMGHKPDFIGNGRIVL